MAGNLNIFLAFTGGLISFFSPCVLPLIPSYLSFIGGVSYNELMEEKKGNWGLFFKSLMFVAGFTIIFVLLGVVFSGVGSVFTNATAIINRIAGVIVIILGLNFIFNFIKILNMDKRFHMTKRPAGFLSPLLLGMAFGAGWTPCIGPILSSILFMAGTSGKVAQGTVLLIVYSFGLGLPFLAGGLFFSTFQKQMQKIKPLMGKIKVFSGIFLILIGVLLFSGSLSEINILFFKAAYGLEEWGTSSPETGSLLFGILFSLLFLLTGFFYFRKLQNRKEGKGVFPFRIALMVVFLLLGVFSFTGVLNVPLLLSSWFLFQGI